jgi:hypothetical protein
MRRLLACLALACALASAASSVVAGVPSASTSVIDPCLVFCPVSDITFTVVVRDIANNPVANSLVKLDFSACPYFHHCPLLPGVNDAARTISAISDANGVARFAMSMGGTCLGSAVRISADNQPLGTRSLVSPDRDGDLFPSLLDEAAIQAAQGTSDPSCDLDCSGLVDAADLAIFERHRFHACPLVVPTAPGSWGRLKTIYR